LVRLLGYCIEGTNRYKYIESFVLYREKKEANLCEFVAIRILVYEYMNNGNLEEWLHGAMKHHGYLTWEARMKVLTGTSKA